MIWFIIGTTLVLIFLNAFYSYAIKPLIFFLYYRNQGIPLDFYYPMFGSTVLMNKPHVSGYQLMNYIEPIIQDNTKKVYMSNFVDSVMLTLFDGEMIRQMTVVHHNKYKKYDFLLYPFLETMGKSLIFAEGKRWKKHRDIIAKQFHFDSLQQMASLMSKAVDNQFNIYQQKLKEADSYTIKDVSGEMQKITADTVLRIFFTKDISQDKLEGKPITEYLTYMLSQLSLQQIKNPACFLLGNWVLKLKLTETDRRVDRIQRNLKNYITQIIEERNQDNTSKYSDLLQALLDYNKKLAEGQEPLGQQEIYGIFMVLFLAGMDTTARLATMAIYYLSQNPDCLVKLRQEIKDTIGENLNQKDISLEQTKKLMYTQAVINETLRIAGPAPVLLIRVATEDHTLGNLKIKKGTFINTCVGANSIREDIFPSALKWDPERFLQKKLDIDQFHFIPFSMGPRNCIGQNFALMEAKIILAKFFDRFNVEVDQNYKLKMIIRFVYEPMDPVVIHLTPKNEQLCYQN